jgi:hypothetical protein
MEEEGLNYWFWLFKNLLFIIGVLIGIIYLEEEV